MFVLVLPIGSSLFGLRNAARSRVLNGSRMLPKARVEDLMTAALAVWAPHGGLHFVKLDDGKADIEVSFVTRDHGDV